MSQSRYWQVTVALIAAICCELGTFSVAEAADDAPRRRVILISLDGLRPDAISAADAKNLQSLIDTGAYSDHCLNELPPATLPNHTTMVTGLGVTQHGVFLNFDMPGTVPHPTLMTVAKESGRKVAFFASKSKMRFLCAPDAADQCVIEFDIEELIDRFIATLNDPPDFAFIHLGQPDGKGHQFDWMSAEYLEAVRLVDRLVGKLNAALIENQLDDTVLIITADHGGQGNTHVWNTSVERHVPLIIHGAGIKSGYAITGDASLRDIAPFAARTMQISTDPPEWFSHVLDEVIVPPPAVTDAKATPAPPSVGSFCLTIPLIVFTMLLGATVIHHRVRKAS